MHQLLDSYKRMLLIRFFEERIEELFTDGVIQGTTHPAIGQEAVAVGVCNALQDGDYITSTHRGHAHFLARGADPKRIMAELYGRRTGYSRGRGGSQLMADYSLGFLGGNGITGGSVPVALGAAFSANYKKDGKVAVAFFGDGAANQGAVHEAMNMAGLWKLPILFLCENNMYAMSTSVRDALPVKDVADRAAAYGFEGAKVDGNDLVAVQNAVDKAASTARSGDGPTLIECKTYRMSGHSRGDPRNYRTKEEEADARRNCPVARMRQMLIEANVLDDAMDREARSEAHLTIEDAIQFALDSEFPDPAEVEEGVFA